MKLSKRQREWVWAVILIILVVGSIWLVGAQGMQLPTITAGDETQTPTTGSTKPVVKDTSIKGVLAGIPEASTFYSYYAASAVPGELGNNTYTLFVPTNSAFAALPKGSVSGLTTAMRKRLLEYHVVSGKSLDTDAVSSGTYQALSRDILNFNVNLQTGVSYVNSGMIIKQYKAKNGIIYMINSVLFPPK